MTSVDDLQRRVEAGYAELDLPSWPAPHPDRPPLDEEYSRLTDPERYRIAFARARVWAAVLEELLGARSEELEPEPARQGRFAFDRGVRLVPPAADALPLLLLERDARIRDGEGTLAVLTIAVAEPRFDVDQQPDCGCDACDSGSDDLISAIDDTIRQVVGGPFVALRGPSWHANWCPDGGSAGSDGNGPDFRATMELCRRIAAGEDVSLPSDVRAYAGKAWTA